MDFQAYLVAKFEGWLPPPPRVEGRTKGDITLRWSDHPFSFLGGDLLYRVQRKEKMPPWVMVYSGGKTTKTIDNLAPRHPHKFRVQVIVRGTAIPTLAEKALQFFGDEKAVRNYLDNYPDEDTLVDDEGKEQIKNNDDELLQKTDEITSDKNFKSADIEQSLISQKQISEGDTYIVREELVSKNNTNDGSGDTGCKETVQGISGDQALVSKKWLESQWSEVTSTSTDTDGTSAVCFCMAVRCGYLKQVQLMLEERPALLEIINSNNGFTPLATAVRKGDINTVRFLLAAGADPNQPSTSGQTPLHLATLGARVPIVDLLLENGADFKACDLNGLRIEHYAVDSGSEEMVASVLQRGGDVHARDYTGWTPLFRAGSIHKSRGRDSVLRLVDSAYPHEQAVANFTRLTKKISSLHTILK